LVSFEQWVRDRLRVVDMRPDSLLAQWSTARGRKALREALHEELGIGVDDLARRLNKPDCDPIDLLIHLGWDQPLKTRRQRADRFTREERAFLDRFEAEARQVLASIVDKYSANGPDDLDAKVLTCRPFPTWVRRRRSPNDSVAPSRCARRSMNSVDDCSGKMRKIFSLQK
jgi:type I restriction enzyme R subunit